MLHSGWTKCVRCVNVGGDDIEKCFWVKMLSIIIVIVSLITETEGRERSLISQSSKYLNKYDQVIVLFLHEIVSQ